MTEKLLQYLWHFKIFKTFNFKDTEGNPLEVLDFGTWNPNAGPDFLFAKIKTKNLTLVGNIELHLKSSDWLQHHHNQNPDYKNIILHVVFIDDKEIQDFKAQNIPTLELKNYIDEETLQKYNSLLNRPQFIPCEKIFEPNKIPFGFHEENILKKLDQKSIEISENLKIFKNNYEAVLFHYLAYAFGLKINAQIFKQLAESIDYSIIQKIRQNQTQLEALFYGKCAWLEHPQDNEMKIWNREYLFLKSKYQLTDLCFHPKFLKLRPPNFPNIRLSQLANLYNREQNLFSKIIHAEKIEELYQIFRGIKASEYWDTHYSFGKISTQTTPKILTSNFIDLIILNVILPLKYAYHKNIEEDVTDKILNFYSHLASEKNQIIKHWQHLKIEIKSALESQSLIYQYQNFCNKKNCLNCGIGFLILKNSK